MTEATTGSVTALLTQLAQGDRSALDDLYGSLYPDLKRLARARLHQQGRGNGMATTVLVHETFMRLVGTQQLRLEDRRHFFAYVSKAMRHIIINDAREHLAQCRGGGADHLSLTAADSVPAAPDSSEELLQVHEALQGLEAVDPELAQTVDLRYFGGYSEAEIAELLEVSERTVRRRWDKARAWLLMNLGDAAPPARSAPMA